MEFFEKHAPGVALRERWRFLDTGAMNGAGNMAVDQALVESVDDSGYEGVVRVYAWNPPAISLGFHQSLSEIDLDKCRQENIDVVVRPTGGRAVLHHQELTYSVVVSRRSSLFQKEIMTVYERISQCLMSGLRLLHIPVAFERADSTPEHFARGELSALCYASAIQYEIGHQGKKLIGSAQRRYEHAVLQHGSILIGGAHLDLTRYLAKGDAKWRAAVRRYMENRTTCLNELAGHNLSYAQVASALFQGFTSTLGFDFLPSELTSKEQQRMREIAARLAQVTSRHAADVP